MFEIQFLNSAKKIDMLKVFGLLIVVAALAFGCSNNKKAAGSSDVSETDYKIYSIVIDQVILSQTDSVPDPSSVGEQVKYIKNDKVNLLLIDSTRTASSMSWNVTRPLEASMAKDFFSKNGSSVKLESKFDNPIKFYLMLRSDFSSFMKNDLHKGYASLYQKYPDVSGMIEVSRIGYNSKNDNAMVIIDFHQNERTGIGYLVELKLEDGVWKITHTDMMWLA